MKKADIVRFRVETSFNNVWDSKFITQNRYAPMLMINQIVYSNPLLLNKSDNVRWGNYKLTSNFFPNSNGRSSKIISLRRTVSNVYWIYTGFYSVICIKNQSYKNLNYVVNSRYASIKNKYTADCDVLILGTVDRNYLKRKDLKSVEYFVFDRKKITLLVSEKVWKNDSYCKQNYSTVLRKYIINFVKSCEFQGMTIKVVPHEYLNRFIDSYGIRLKTNSLLKVKEIEHEVKDVFFSNLNIQQFE